MTNLTEKYRPKKLDEVLGQSHIVPRLKQFAADYRAGGVTIPNLLLTGPPGVGKTTVAHALAREMYGDAWRSVTLDLNASADRGIDVIRGRVADFARTRSIGEDRQMVFLDECDALTGDAQTALRRIMEDHSRNTLFVLACNYPNRIIPPVKSRCTTFEFAPIPDTDGVAALARVCDVEGITTEVGALETLWARAGGDMRRALNILAGVQAPVTVAKVSKKDGRDAARAVIKYAGTGALDKADAALADWLKDAGTDEACSTLFDVLAGSKLGEGAKNRLLFTLGEVEYRIAVGATAAIQLRAWLRGVALAGEKKEEKKEVPAPW